jgi:ribosomal protein L35AE/L33A
VPLHGSWLVSIGKLSFLDVAHHRQYNHLNTLYLLGAFFRGKVPRFHFNSGDVAVMTEGNLPVY